MSEIGAVQSQPGAFSVAPEASRVLEVVKTMLAEPGMSRWDGSRTGVGWMGSIWDARTLGSGPGRRLRVAPAPNGAPGGSVWGTENDGRGAEA